MLRGSSCWIGRRGRGFVYCVSATGVTGGDVAIGDELRGFLGRARKEIDLPLVVGFGIRTPKQAAQIGALADGVVIASQIVRLVEDAPDAASAAAAVSGFAAAVREALERPS